MDSPRISVLMPARDAERTIGAAMASVLRSSEPSLECVVVDDASRDGTRRLVQAVAASDSRVRLLEGAGKGLVAALEVGRAACRSAWVARMDADDLMHRSRLSLQLHAAEENGWDACGTHVRMFPRAGLTDGSRSYERWIASLRTAEDIRRDAYVECPLVHPTLLIRREVLAYREMGWPEDYDMVLRLLEERRTVGLVPRRLLSWRDNPARLSRTHPSYSLGAFAACKANFMARGFLAQSPGYLLVGYGPTGKLLRAALSKEGKDALAIVDLKPGRIGQRIDGAQVFGPDSLGSLPLGPTVVCVAGLAPRTLARNELVRSGRIEGRDFICAA